MNMAKRNEIVFASITLNGEIFLIACQIYWRKDDSLFSSRMYRLYEKGDMDGLTLWPFRMRPGRPGSRRRRRCHCCHPIRTLGRHRGLAPGRSRRKGRPRPLLTAGSDDTTSLPSFSDTWFNENLELAGSRGHTPAEKSVLELTWGQVFTLRNRNNTSLLLCKLLFDIWENVDMLQRNVGSFRASCFLPTPYS